jgi:hypothetical protein
MSTDANLSASSNGGGRAHPSGPQMRFLGAGLVAAAIAIVVILLINANGGSTPVAGNPVHLQLTKVYGHPAKSIKIPEPPKIPTATASARHPDLSQQPGYSVTVTLPHGSTHLFMAGPLLSSHLANDVSEHKVSLFASVPGKFEVTFTDSHGTVPLSANALTLITYRGVVLHPTVTLANGGPLPATVPDHKTLKLTMQAKVPEGDGLIRWSPIRNRILVGVFWTTEFD